MAFRTPQRWVPWLLAAWALLAGCSSPATPVGSTPQMYTYTIVFDSQNADQEAVPAQIKVVSPAETAGSLPAEPVKAGWSFGGWFTEPEGQGTAFGPQTPVVHDATVYAKWTYVVPTEYTFSASNGTVRVSQMENSSFVVSYTPGISLSSANLYATIGNSTGLAAANQAMSFAGGTWTTKVSHPSFKGGVKVAFDILQLASGIETSVPQGKLSDSGTWASFVYSEMYTYTVTFDDHEATTPSVPHTKKVTNPATNVGTLPSAPLREGYVFDGWFTGPAGTGEAFRANTPVGGDLTVYAAWSSAQTWTVSFDGQGAEVAPDPQSFTVLTGKPVKRLPVIPRREGFAFYGWFTAPQGQGQPFTEASSIQADTTVYAFWKPASPSPLGPNVVVFDPSMPSADIQARLDGIFHAQQKAEFGSNRYAILFKPGTYDVNVNVGFYMQILGLGRSPDDVLIRGSVQSDGASDVTGNHHVTQNFWRSMENLAVDPTAQVWNMWGVSQAAPARRIHVKGDLWLFDVNPNNNASGWASGGFLGDSLVDGSIAPGGQQQWLYRNSAWGSATGGVWNMVFVGAKNAPATSFGKIPNYTTFDTTPKIREKPYLFLAPTADSSDDYRVFVPALAADSQGPTWTEGPTTGKDLPLSDFYVAQPSTDTVETLNAALAQGKHLLFTPGLYHLGGTLHVDKPGTILLGLGLATLVAEGGPAIQVADVDGVTLAGLLIEAGPQGSSVLVQIGPPGSSARHADPTLLSDVFLRVGGAIPGRTVVGMEIHSSDVLGDNLWIWRADHGVDGSTWGWTVNTADHGLVVQGQDVTIYGLAVEHFQKYQTVWNGEGGKVYFYQSETPYDVPDQASWKNGTIKGWASYKVGDSVTSHFAAGVGVYCFFNVNPSVQLESAIEVPPAGLDTMFHNMVTVALGSPGTVGQINHVINGRGAAVVDAGNPTYLTQ